MMNIGSGPEGKRGLGTDDSTTESVA